MKLVMEVVASRNLDEDELTYFHEDSPEEQQKKLDGMEETFHQILEQSGFLDDDNRVVKLRVE